MKLSILVLAALGSLAPSATAQTAPPQQIYGNVAGLNCQGAANATYPGFTAFVFSFAEAIQGGGQVAGRVAFPNITLTKGLDDCTPVLFGAVATGRRFASVTLTVVSGNPATPLLLVTLQDVTFMSDRFTEDAADVNARDLDEEVTIAYSRITIKHVPSGKSFSFDVSRNISIP